MKLTVIIPVFNTEEYLPACLASISAQTARGEMKLILVDDGSTDGSGKLCDDFAASDPDTRVLHTENGGVSRARNAALELVDTPYFGFCDSDDTLEPDYYERLLTAAEKVGADIAFCGMNFDRGEEKRPRPAFRAAGVRTAS